MASLNEPDDGADSAGVAGEGSSEMAAAVFRALERIDGDVSPQLARSVQARINAIKKVGREFGFLTEGEATDVLSRENDVNADAFALWYRGEKLYPRFLFEPSPAAAGVFRLRPLMKDLMKIVDKYGWDGPDVVLWMTSPTTWFADEARPVDHLDEPARVLAALEDQAGARW